MKSSLTTLSILLFLIVPLLVSCGKENRSGQIPIDSAAYTEWNVTSGDKSNSKYSSLDPISKSNASRLDVARADRTGHKTRRSTIQANPLIVHGVMSISPPSLQSIALDARAGKGKWVFDGDGRRHQNRGVTWWEGE